MENIQFETKFSNLRKRVTRSGPRYETQIKENFKTKQLDELLTGFADSYFDADNAQKKEIFDFFADKKIRFDFWIYIERVALLIKDKDDGKWLQRGLMAAILDGGRGEIDDWKGERKTLYISLLMLRYGAERVGIDAKTYFDDARRYANDSVKLPLIRAFNEDEYRFAIQTAGPEEWANEIIENYGEHPLYVDMKKKMEEQDKLNARLARLRKITILAILGVGGFIIIGLVIAYLLQPH